MTSARFTPIAVIIASVTAGPANGQPAVASRAAVVTPSVEHEFRARIAELERQIESLKQQLSGLVASAPAPALTSDPTPAPPSVEEKIEALDQRLRVFAREDELRREAQSEQARVAPAVGASRDGFQLRSADGAFALRLRGIVQSDNRFFLNDSADTGADTFVLRRVRPTVEATFFKNFDLRLVPDFGNGQAVVQDAYMDLKFATAFRIRAGKQKQPFGIERLVSSSDLLFVERALPTTVAGNRDIGVMAYGDLLTGRLSYFAGAFNGVIDGSSADFDERDGKDVIVRLFAHPFRTSKDERLQGLGVGVAAAHGSQRGTVALPSVAVYRTAGQQVYFRYLSDGTVNGTTIADGTRQRISAQGYYYYRRFGLLGEQVFSSQDIRRGLATAKAHVNSWQLAPSWVLTGESSSYRGVAPRKPFDPVNGEWGAFELTGRYNQLSIDDELFPVFASRNNAADTARGGAVGLNWYMNRNVKIVFNYEQTRFVGGAAGGENRRTEHDILSRVQFSF